MQNKLLKVLSLHCEVCFTQMSKTIISVCIDIFGRAGNNGVRCKINIVVFQANVFVLNEKQFESAKTLSVFSVLS